MTAQVLATIAFQRSFASAAVGRDSFQKRQSWEQWLRGLDGRRGIFLRYADILLRLSGGDLKAMASLYNETNDDLDHSIWNQISSDTLGHKLLLRKGFRSLHRAMNCPS